MISEETRDKWRRRTDICYNHLNELDEYERSLIISLKKSLNINRNFILTIRQSYKLDKIFYKICNNSITGVV